MSKRELVRVERDGDVALVVMGDPDEVGEQLSSVLALGVDGLTCNLAANGHDPENVELLGETLTKVMQA